MKPSTTLASLLVICTSTEAFVPSGFRKPFTAVAVHSSSLIPSQLWRKMQGDDENEVGLQSSLSEKTTNKSKDPTPVLFSAAKNMFKDSQEESKALVMASLLGLALMMSPLSADAAMSGGRMGGSYSSQPSVTRMAPTRSSSSRGFGSGFASGFGAGVLSRPGYGFSPFYSPLASPFASPFVGPGYYGGPGVITYSRGPGLFPFLLVGGLALAVASNVANGVSDAVEGVSERIPSVFPKAGPMSALGPGTSVVQLSVALEVPNRDSPSSILSILNRLAQTARTDSRVGIQNLTSQVALELLRRKSSIVSAAGSSKHFGDRAQALRNFSQKAIKERGKFEQETVSNYGGVDYGFGGGMGRADSSTASGKATMAVVTLLLNIDGDSISGMNLPSINSVRDVEEVLRKIASDTKVDDCLQSAEILWTPEDRFDTLTHKDVIADYPELRSV